MTRRIVGYTDVICAAPGERVRFMVSCEPPVTRYDARIVRMLCGVTQPGGPGLRHRPVGTNIDGSYAARHQAYRPGAHVVVAHTPALERLRSLTMQVTVFPTLAGRPCQTILAKRDADTGFALFLDSEMHPVLRVGGATALGARPLRTRLWCRITASYDADQGTVRLMQEELPCGLERVAGHTAHHLVGPQEVRCAAALTIGGTDGFFNGRIEHPVLTAAPDSAESDILARWDFSVGIGSDHVTDVAGGAHGRTVNQPLRAVRGSAWDGRTMCWRDAPAQYAAMHFLEDALGDCGWAEDFTLEVPPDLPSGCYAAWLQAGADEDFIPFFVRPPRDRATHDVALLIPTVSYQAYANWRLPFENPLSELMMNALPVLGDEDRYLLEHPDIGPSLYDAHADGTSATRVTRLRPDLNMRPTHPWLEQYPADLLLVDWLDRNDVGVDVVTDHDLHAEGTPLLARYRCVLTGTHPEYYSTPMWDGLHGYLAGGGRLMYLGGNGFVWRVGFDPAAPSCLELRRGETGSSIGRNDPGEYVMASTGEYGGSWERIGRPPQSLVGVGFIAQGFDFSAGYARLPDAASAAWVFEGVSAEVVGAFGLQGHGAAGVEVDRADEALGTPRHAVRLASSAGLHTATYRLANAAMLDQPQVRADLTFFQTPAGGAVFSVGSMAWAAALPHAGGDNDVARITGNVLRRFLDPTSF